MMNNELTPSKNKEIPLDGKQRHEGPIHPRSGQQKNKATHCPDHDIDPNSIQEGLSKVKPASKSETWKSARPWVLEWSCALYSDQHMSSLHKS